MEYGIFVKVGIGKFIKIFYKGGKILEEKFSVFKNNGVDFFYVKKEDFVRIVGFIVNILKFVNNSFWVDEVKKICFI